MKAEIKPTIRSSAKEPHTEPLEVLGYVGPEKGETATSGPSGEAVEAIAGHSEPDSRAAEILEAAE